MNDSSWIVSVNVINIAHGASGGMSQPYIIRDRTSLAWCADINSDKQSLFCDELIQWFEAKKVLTERITKFVFSDAWIDLEITMGWLCTKTPSQPFTH